LIAFNAEHLRRILAKYAIYYNEARTHVSLGKDAPCTRPIERFGDVVAHPVLGGLHHAAICGGLSWIGVRLDAGRNRSANNPVNDHASRCSVHVLASQEDEQIARHTWALFPRGLS
jgi:hypothetical protein